MSNDGRAIARLSTGGIVHIQIRSASYTGPRGELLPDGIPSISAGKRLSREEKIEALQEHLRVTEIADITPMFGAYRPPAKSDLLGRVMERTERAIELLRSDQPVPVDVAEFVLASDMMERYHSEPERRGFWSRLLPGS